MRETRYDAKTLILNLGVRMTWTS